MNIEYISVVDVYDISWLELASISIDEGTCGLNWIYWVQIGLCLDWLEVAWNRLDRLGLRIGLVY